MAAALLAIFLAIMCGVPIGHAIVDGQRGRAAWSELLERRPTRAGMARFEDELETSSSLRHAVRARLQALLTAWGGFGNDKVVLGRPGWLFYAPGVASVAGPGFLDPDAQAARRATADPDQPRIHPDPRPAILDFQRMLESRGIRLVLLPVPDKAMLEARSLHRRLDPDGVLPVVGNPDHVRFVAEMRTSGVDVFDPTPTTVETGAPSLFLAQDTHWTPQWMEEVAAGLARLVTTSLPPRPPRPLRVVARRVRRVGDLVDMLGLPAAQTLFAPQRVVIHRIEDDRGHPHQPSATADVLLLGDSFTNIYSLASMGWGGAAGLGAQLAAALARDVDVIAQNDAGAHATRQLLARELGAGRDRLAGKRVVIWQFAARELAVGDWRPVIWPGLGARGLERVAGVGEGAARRFFVPPAGAPVLVSAVVAQASPVPRPGDVPYKDHIRALHLRQMAAPARPEAGGEILAYVYSMRDSAWTRAAALVPGARVNVRLRPWSAVAADLDGVNRSELDDEALLEAEPAWAELE